MDSSELMTTGEAANLLNISRSTVSRKYDQGLLRGKTNPITGERMIGRDSIMSFLRQYNMPIPEVVSEKKAVLICTPDDSVRGHLRELFSGDERVAITDTESGCDALVEFPKTEYALFMVDADLPDIATPDVIKTLKKGRADDEVVRVVCMGHESQRTSMREWDVDAMVLKQSFTSEEASDQIYDALGMPKRPVSIKSDYEHQRQWPRVPVDFPVRLSVYRLSAPKTRDEGEANVMDVSCGGMLLTNVKLASGALPLDPFRMVIYSDGEPLPDWKSHAQVVRLRSGEPVSVAVQYTKISKPHLQMVMDLVLSLQRQQRD